MKYTTHLPGHPCEKQFYLPIGITSFRSAASHFRISFPMFFIARIPSTTQSNADISKSSFASKQPAGESHRHRSHGVSRTRGEKPTLFFEKFSKNFADIHNSHHNKDLHNDKFCRYCSLLSRLTYSLVGRDLFLSRTVFADQIFFSIG